METKNYYALFIFSVNSRYYNIPRIYEKKLKHNLFHKPLTFVVSLMVLTVGSWLNIFVLLNTTDN